MSPNDADDSRSTAEVDFIVQLELPASTTMTKSTSAVLRLSSASFGLIVALSFIVCTTNASCSSSNSCPGSPALTNAKCDMTVSFPQASTTCGVVSAEIMARLNGDNQWMDPHNRGKYTLIESSSTSIRGSRETGDGKYTDLFGFELSSMEGGGCELKACSQSQVFSILDASTNYCNLRSLYCNSSDNCPVVNAELEYEEKYNNCWQRKAGDCIATRTEVSY